MQTNYERERIFRRLFNINIASYIHFEYYLKLLSNLKKYKDIYHNWLEFQSEDIIDFNIKKDKIIDDIISYVKTTEAYENLRNASPKQKASKTSDIRYSDGCYYLSLDIISANYNVLSLFDTKNELRSSYHDLMIEFGASETMIKSKKVRQYIFGNLSPAKISSESCHIITEFSKIYEANGFRKISINSDEAIFQIEKNTVIDNSLLENVKVPIRTTLFTPKIIDDITIIEYLDSDYKKTGESDIYCSNGDMLHYNIKKHILNESIELQDCIFRHSKQINGMLLHPEVLNMLNMQI